MDPTRRPGAAGGTVKSWPGGSRGLPGPRLVRHLERPPAAAAPKGAAAAAGNRATRCAAPWVQLVNKVRAMHNACELGAQCHAKCRTGKRSRDGGGEGRANKEQVRPRALEGPGGQGQRGGAKRGHGDAMHISLHRARRRPGEWPREHVPRKLMCTVYGGVQTGHTDAGGGRQKGRGGGKEQERGEAPKGSMPRSVSCILLALYLVPATQDSRGQRSGTHVEQEEKG